MQLRGAEVEQVIDVINCEKRKNLQKDEKRYLTKGNGSGNISFSTVEKLKRGIKD